MSATEIAALGTPTIKPSSGPPPTRLESRDLKKGWGATAEASDEVAVEYVGASYRTGRPLWYSRERLGPFRFQLGGYGVIPGWERGIGGMKVGGRRELVIPSKLAGGIGARIYVIDLVGVHRQTKLPVVAGASDGPQDPGAPAIALPSPPPPKRLIVRTVRQGSGRVAPVRGEVTVRSIGVDYKTAYSFLNAWGPDTPTHITLTSSSSVWARALAGMKVGGRRDLFVPARLAYGGGPIVYAFELVSIDQGAPG